MPAILIQTAGGLLAGLLVIAVLFSWVVLLSGRFRTSFIMPRQQDDRPAKGRVWFVLQSFALLFAAFIVLMRMDQLLEGHRDNVIENLVYGVSGLLFVRMLGDFKYFGWFRSQTAGEFTTIDRKWLSPFATICFVLSWPLL